MTKVYVIKCEKWNDKSRKFQVIDVFTNQKQALAFCRINTNDIHRYFYSVYEINRNDYISIANEIWNDEEFKKLIR